MSKYQPLEKHLAQAALEQVPMTFDEIERIIGSALPASARKHRAWWSNNPSNSVITHAWLNAGYKTARVDLESGKLVFEKANPKGSAPSVRANDTGPKPPRHPIIGHLKGLIVFPKDTDLTDPADPDWGDAR